MEKKVITSIAGPSGSGKTTLTDRLLQSHDLGIPCHITTRSPRNDDKLGFYDYISLEKFELLKKQGAFLIGSNDSSRGYGVLKKSCEESFEDHDTILINSSFKDIFQLKQSIIPVRLIVLTFQDLEKSIYERIINSSRNHNQQDIDYRVRSAIEDYERYFSEVSSFAKVVIYTDIFGKQETYEIAENALGFEPQIRKRVR